MQHLNTGHDINAEKFECEIINGILFFRFILKPAGSNQKYDEEMIHNEKILSFEIVDEKIISGLGDFINNNKNKISNISIELTTRDIKKVYDVEIDVDRYNKNKYLRFLILE